MYVDIQSVARNTYILIFLGYAYVPTVLSPPHTRTHISRIDVLEELEKTGSPLSFRHNNWCSSSSAIHSLSRKKSGEEVRSPLCGLPSRAGADLSSGWPNLYQIINYYGIAFSSFRVCRTARVRLSFLALPGAALLAS
jgi:hypothetical protein